MSDYDYGLDLDLKTFQISWQNIDSGARAIASNIQRNYEPDVIICRQHDVITASIVARVLDLPLCIVHPQERIKGTIIKCLPAFSKYMSFPYSS